MLEQNLSNLTSIEALQAEFDKVFLLEDKGALKIVCASIIANRLPLDPVWMLLVAPSSGGKTEFIQAMTGLDFVHAVSDLTVNTFASGFKKTGTETSLLLRINKGVIAFKDFTSILSKPREARDAIMGQLREIYDGTYVKETGTGEQIKWSGKVGALAGSTEAIYEQLEELSKMGDRFVMYSIKQPDRLLMAERALTNTSDIVNMREHLKKASKAYIAHVLNHLIKDEKPVELAPESRKELLAVANFATLARSAVITDFKSGLVKFVPEKEMPTRVVGQLTTLATAFIAMAKAAPGTANSPIHNGQLSPEDYRLLYKVAFDSIPKMRRVVIYAMAQFKGGVSTAGLATTLDLPTPSVGRYLSQVNALGICKRVKKSGPQGDHWMLREEYRDIILRNTGIVLEEGILLSDSEPADDEWEAVEAFQKSKEVDSLDISHDPEGTI